MKGLMVLAGLLLFLVLALLAYRTLDASRQEQLVIGWSNSLVWSALGTPTTPQFDDAALTSAEGAGRWTVTGSLAYREEAGALVERDYRAGIEQVCPDQASRACWRLAALALDGVAVDLTPPPPPEPPQPEPPGPEPPGPEPVVQAPPEAALPAESGAETQAGPQAQPEPVPEDPVALLQAIQQALNAAGYDAGPADGQIGPRTRAAIRAYQAASGLAVDGAPSAALLRQLRGAGSN